MNTEELQGINSPSLNQNHNKTHAHNLRKRKRRDFVAMRESMHESSDGNWVGCGTEQGSSLSSLASSILLVFGPLCVPCPVSPNPFFLNRI